MWDDARRVLYFQVGNTQGWQHFPDLRGDYDFWRLPQVDDTAPDSPRGDKGGDYSLIRHRPVFVARPPGSTTIRPGGRSARTSPAGSRRLSRSTPSSTGPPTRRARHGAQGVARHLFAQADLTYPDPAHGPPPAADDHPVRRLRRDRVGRRHGARRDGALPRHRRQALPRAGGPLRRALRRAPGGRQGHAEPLRRLRARPLRALARARAGRRPARPGHDAAAAARGAHRAGARRAAHRPPRRLGLRPRLARGRHHLARRRARGHGRRAGRPARRRRLRRRRAHVARATCWARTRGACR